MDDCCGIRLPDLALRKVIPAGALVCYYKSTHGKTLVKVPKIIRCVIWLLAVGFCIMRIHYGIKSMV